MICSHCFAFHTYVLFLCRRYWRWLHRSFTVHLSSCLCFRSSLLASMRSDGRRSLLPSFLTRPLPLPSIACDDVPMRCPGHPSPLPRLSFCPREASFARSGAPHLQFIFGDRRCRNRRARRRLAGGAFAACVATRDGYAASMHRRQKARLVPLLLFHRPLPASPHLPPGNGPVGIQAQETWWSC